MTAVIKHRNTFIQGVRLVIGDTDEILFSQDELLGYIERFMELQKITSNITAQSNRYRIGFPEDGGFYDVDIVSGYDPDGVYLIDEIAGTILFDINDSGNTGTPPADGDQLTVTYFDVDYNNLIAELFFTLSSNHTKLCMAQSLLTSSMDLTRLKDEFWSSCLRWKAQGDDDCGCC